MSYKLDYDVPIPKVVERLKADHVLFREKFREVNEEIAKGNLGVADSILSAMKSLVLRHAVEEEARIVGIIAEKAKDQLQPTVDIMRYHRRIEEFLQERLPHLSEEPQRKAVEEIQEFLSETEKHHDAEEKKSFPLALKAYGEKKDIKS